MPIHAFSRLHGACLVAAVSTGALLPLANPDVSEALPASVTNAVPAAIVPASVPAAPALSPAQWRAARATRLRAKVVRVALSKRKTGRYVAGAASWNRFDCSGFTMMLYKRVAHKNLPHYSGLQMRRTKRVSRKHLLKGDLLFWGPGGSRHVSMYIGRGKMIGANNPRSNVRVESINSAWYRPLFAGAGRVIMG